jgi:uncharacterized protein (DUF697 family)
VGYLLVYALFAALLIAYLALGTLQAFAIVAGLVQRGFGRWSARVVALLLAYLPVLGSAAAVRGATVGWGWTTGKGLIRFFGPLAAIMAVLLLG